MKELNNILTLAATSNEQTENVAAGISDAFSGVSIPIVLVSVLALILLIVMFVRHSKKTNTVDSIKSEIIGYIYPTEPFQYSGNITVSQNRIQYSRGNRSVNLDICLEKTTVLAPFMADEWFVGRNYSYQEAVNIVNDIAHYLKENKICNATVVSDEVYNEMYGLEEEITDED